MILVAVAMGLLFPGTGRAAGPWEPEKYVRFAVFGIFFLQGMVLPVRELARGLLLWKFHTLVLAFNFLLAPALAWLLFGAPWSPVDRSTALGFLYLGILPTTISSAVALTAASKGDSASALFGVTLSNLAGIIMVPLGIVFWMNTGAGGGGEVNLSFTDALIRVAKLIALPMALGQAARNLLPAIVPWTSHRVGPLSQALIVSIVWILFAKSAASGGWGDFNARRLASTSAGVVIYFVILGALFLGISATIRLQKSEKIAAYFCCTQKGLATGAPMATAFFLTASEAGRMPPLGLILLPLLLYHPLQLIAGSLLASRFQNSPP